MTRAGDQHPELPVDSDVDPAAGAARPPRPRLVHVLAVAFGGAAGTLLRYWLSVILPTAHGAFPLATFATNLLGAFALGALLEGIATAGPEEPRDALLRVSLGTGLIGGFTTYSTFAVEGVRLLGEGLVGTGLVYMVGTGALGLACSMGGIAVGAALSRALRGRDRMCSDADGSREGLGR